MKHNTLRNIILTSVVSMTLISQCTNAATTRQTSQNQCAMQAFNLDWHTDMMNPYTLPMHVKNKSVYVLVKNFQTSVEIEAAISGEVKYYLKPGQSALLSTSTLSTKLTIKPRYTGQAVGTATLQLN